jgi:hypothetical protein
LSSIKYGSTTFNLPDCNNRVLQGGERGYKEAGLPNIEGRINTSTLTEGSTDDECEGAFIQIKAESNKLTGGASYIARKWEFDASRSNPIYGNSDTVQPPALCLNMIIKI